VAHDRGADGRRLHAGVHHRPLGGLIQPFSALGLFLFSDTAFPTFLWNTLWVGVLVVAITLVFGLPAAYSLARLDRPWSGPMGIALFFVYLVPPTLLFLSLTRIVVGLGLQDSTWSLVVIYPTITIPICTWLLIGFL
jgi:multiple sugar transport system permease protein